MSIWPQKNKSSATSKSEAIEAARGKFLHQPVINRTPPRTRTSHSDKRQSQHPALTAARRPTLSDALRDERADEWV